MLFLAALSHNGVDKPDDFLVYFMGLKDGVNHDLLRNLIGAGFNHDDLFPGGGHGQGHVRHLLLVGSGVDDEFAVNQTYLRGSAGTCKGDVGNAGCNGRTQHGCQLRAAVRVHAHYNVVQGYVVAVILRKQRTHGAVDNAAGQNCILRSLALPLVESAWNLSYGV